MRLGDEQFQEHIAAIMELDWRDYDLTIFGGITGDWDTPDIDACIWGVYDPEHIIYLLTEMKRLGPWDAYYSTHPDGKDWNNTKSPITVNMAKPVDRMNSRANARFGGVWQDGLYWLNFRLPTRKMKQRGSAYKYGKPITLIQNGQQLYF